MRGKGRLWCLAAWLCALPLCHQSIAAGAAEEHWLLNQKTDFAQFLNNLKTKETLARGVLDQAHRAEAHALELNDQQALPIARQAVALAEQGLGKAHERVARQDEKLAAIDRALSLKTAVPGVTLAIRGEVQKQEGKAWVPLTSAAPLKSGEAIRTGLTGSADVIFRDGSRVQLGPNSEFLLEEQTPQRSTYRLLNGFIHDLFKPPQRFRTFGGGLRGQLIQYNTPTAILAVRGTEFDLKLDEQGVTHLVPYAGTMELTAEAGKLNRSKLDRWWESGTPAAAPTPLPPGKVLRLAALQGEVRIEGVDGASRAAAVGDLLARGERLITGDTGLAHLDLAGGYRASAGPNTRLKIATENNSSGRQRCALEQGRVHMVGTPAHTPKTSRSPGFVTPNAVLRGNGAEFEVTVDAHGLTDVIPLAGSLEVTAKREPLDLERIQPWWNEP